MTRIYFATPPIRCSPLLRSGSQHGQHLVWITYHFPLFSMANANSNKPVKVLRLRGISASIFANKSNGDGGESVYHKVTVQRTYRDGDEFKTTTSFTRDDLPIVDLLVNRSWAFILEAESTASKS